jgi:aminoglycoside 6-adenylyltransferase
MKYNTNDLLWYNVLMRSPQEMLDLILSIARSDERIRAVIMNGSRANPSAPVDIFQDFDIVYFVTDPAPFTRNLQWIERFGERMIMQLPDDMSDPPPEDWGGYTYLMQFADGNRIDLGIFPLNRLDRLERDSQTVLLLDKDGVLPAFEPASDNDYLPKPPSAKQFADCCNEFWWVCPYVAKGLWREEILYAKYMLDSVIRPELMTMLRWYIGMRTDFQVNPGKFGKYYQKYLEPKHWRLLENTYSSADYECTWQALFNMCDLFRMTALQVAQRLGLDYPAEDDRRVTAHLWHVKHLPKDAAEIY